VICPRLFWAFRDDVCASGRFCGSFYSSLSSLLMVVTHVPFLMDLLFLFSPLPPLSCVGLMSSGSISFHFLVTQEHDANRALIVSHDDILQTYVKMRGAQSSFKNQDVPTLVLVIRRLHLFVHTSVSCRCSPCAYTPQTTSHTIVSLLTLVLIYTSLFFFLSHRAFLLSFLLPFERFLLTCVRCVFLPVSAFHPNQPSFSFLSRSTFFFFFNCPPRELMMFLRHA